MYIEIEESRVRKNILVKLVHRNLGARAGQEYFGRVDT